jgi:hypothetical protein
VTSRVVEGGLYLKGFYEVDIKLDAKKNFTTPSMRGKGCLHSGMWLKKKCACALQHAAKSETPCKSCSKAQTCAYCSTDFIVSTENKSVNCVHLQVKAYRNLGGGEVGNTSSQREWLAQTRPFAVSKEEEVHFYHDDCSLEKTFEPGVRKRILLGIPRSHARRGPKSSTEARIAFHEKYWRPPVGDWNSRGWYSAFGPFD